MLTCAISFLLAASSLAQDAPVANLSFIDSAGDVDRDGSSDLIVGTWIDRPGDDAVGEVIVYSGKTGKVLYTYKSHQEGSGFGTVVAGVGDLNEDGAGEFAIGAPFEDFKGERLGSVTVFNGQDGKVMYILRGERPDEWFGWSVENAGDVNQDGFADVIIGAPNGSFVEGKGKRAKTYANAGTVMIQSGGPNSRELYRWHGEKEGDRFGFSVAGSGDVDGDGFGDVVIGAPIRGYAVLYRGQDGKPKHRFGTGKGKDSTGFRVDTAGDANQSGTSDTVVAIPFSKDAGAEVYAGLSGKQLFFLPGKREKTGWWYATSVAGVGDANADGFADILVGDPGLEPEDAELLMNALGLDLPKLLTADPGLGIARLYSGNKGKLIHEFAPPEGSYGFGLAVRPAGDVDQDGTADVLIGVASESPTAYVYSGKTGKLIWKLDPNG